MSANESDSGSDSDAVPTAYDIAGGEYKKHLASHAPGTGGWLASSPIYQQWLDGTEYGLLWIRGIPGSGNSVMAANLIHDLANTHPECPVLLFFFRQIIDANHASKALLRDWVDQLLEYSPPLQQTLAEYVDKGQGIDGVSMDDVRKDLRMGFAHLPGKVFCIVDALDDMDRGHDAFLEALEALGKWRPEKVEALITSRPVPTVELPLRKVPCLRLRLEENLVDVDISTYVRHSLASSDILEGDWKTVENAVPGRANGLLLYSKLAMDAFLEPGANIEDVLRHLPLDLNELYTDLLDEHSNRSRVAHPTQRLVLQSGETPLFSFASRPPSSFGTPYYYLVGYKVQYTEKEAFPLLKRLGLDFWDKDDGGKGALYMAASGDMDRFRELMELGLDVTAEDGEGKTAVDVAAACGNREELELFEEGN